MEPAVETEPLKLSLSLDVEDNGVDTTSEVDTDSGVDTDRGVCGAGTTSVKAWSLELPGINALDPLSSSAIETLLRFDDATKSYELYTHTYLAVETI